MPTINPFNNQVLAADVTFNGGTFSAGTDATSGAINIGTGAAARTTTIGNTTGASVLNLKTGTGDFSLASATGNIIVAQDTGEVTKPLQPVFQVVAAAQNDVTGDGTNYTVTFTTTVFNVGSYFDGTSTFTAPVTGKYLLIVNTGLSGILSGHTTGETSIVTSNRTYTPNTGNFFAAGAGGVYKDCISVIADMDAADTAVVRVLVSGSTKVVDVTTAMKFFGILLA